MLDSIYHNDIKISVQSLMSNLWRENVRVCHIYVTLLKVSSHNVTRKSVNHNYCIKSRVLIASQN